MRPTAARTALAAGLVSLLVGLSAATAAGDEVRESDVRSLLGGTKAAFSLERALRRITREDGFYLGRAVAARILERYPAYEDPAGTRYLNLVGRSLTLAGTRTEAFDRYRFIILDSAEVNAFAVPGAFIFVTRGMLRVARDEDMLAAILAHEIAHLQERHGYRLIKLQQWKRFWKDALLAGVDIAKPKAVANLAGTLGAMSGQLFGALSTRGYERRMDLEADAAAVAMLAAVGYDPYALIEVLRALDGAGQRSGFAKTHPKPRLRIRQLEPLISRAAQRRPAARQERFEEALRESRGVPDRVSG